MTRKILRCVVITAALLSWTFPAWAGGVLNNPSSSQVFLLQQIYSNSTPDYNELAQYDHGVISADEFHKQAAISAAVNQLKSTTTSLRGITSLTINLNNSFSAYDSDYHEYDFDINDGTYIPYDSAFGSQVQIALTNGTDAQTWTLDPDAAQKAFNRNGGSSYVTLVLNLSLLPSSPAIDGQPEVLNAKIISYDILSNVGSIKLGHVTVQNSP